MLAPYYYFTMIELFSVVLAHVGLSPLLELIETRQESIRRENKVQEKLENVTVIHSIFYR